MDNSWVNLETTDHDLLTSPKNEEEEDRRAAVLGAAGCGLGLCGTEGAPDVVR